MRSVLLLVLALSSAACKKDEGQRPAASAEAPAPRDPAAKPTTPSRSAKLPDLPKPAPTAPAKTVDSGGLPPEANPPGVPHLDGKLEEDRGVKYIDEKVGTGPLPVKGKPVKVHYSGWLTDGKKFDASVDRGEPIEFPFDTGMVVKGWDIGLSSMKVGGKRRIILPAELAYGDQGAGDVIPAGSVLVFDVELVDAQQ